MIYLLSILAMSECSVLLTVISRGHYTEEQSSKTFALQWVLCRGNFLKNYDNSFPLNKLGGVGPVHNRPPTDKLHHFVKKNNKKNKQM